MSGFGRLSIYESRQSFIGGDSLKGEGMKREVSRVEIFTDGACSGNPGPGGYAAILRYEGKEKLLSGGEELTTNNRMELRALAEALKALKRSCSLRIYTDSKYLADGINKGWAESWRARGWRKADGKEALNSDLWELLLTELKKHEYEIVWVRGHSGFPENERCDELAVAEALKMKRR